MSGLPQVGIADVKGFARQWTHKGVAILVDDIHAEFTRDFANVAIRQIIQQIMAAQAAAADAKKIKLTDV